VGVVFVVDAGFCFSFFGSDAVEFGLEEEVRALSLPRFSFSLVESIWQGDRIQSLNDLESWN
jgi:hypothetical protein